MFPFQNSIENVVNLLIQSFQVINWPENKGRVTLTDAGPRTMLTIFLVPPTFLSFKNSWKEIPVLKGWFLKYV